jgi:hypothetical protein
MTARNQLPAVQIVTMSKATRAKNDREKFDSWVANLRSSAQPQALQPHG